MDIIIRIIQCDSRPAEPCPSRKGKGLRPLHPYRSAAYQPLLLGLILVLSTVGLSGEPDSRAEYELKAAFLFNFSRFVIWPQEQAERDFFICVLGRDPFGLHLEPLAGRKAGGRHIRILRSLSIAEARSCQVLFIAGDSTDEVVNLVASFKGLPILTVSDRQGFALGGGIIELVQDENRLGFEINLEIARGGGLEISSKLLQLARKVYLSRPP